MDNLQLATDFIEHKLKGKYIHLDVIIYIKYIVNMNNSNCKKNCICKSRIAGT